MIGQEVADIAKTWIGVPYQHRGVARAGCDCTGLLIGILQEMGYLKDYQLRYYPKDWNLHAMASNYIAEEIDNIANKVSFEHAPGDLVLFKFGKCVAHLGIVIEFPIFVHSFFTARKVSYGVLNPISPWTSRLIYTYRLDESKLRSNNGGQ